MKGGCILGSKWRYVMVKRDEGDMGTGEPLSEATFYTASITVALAAEGPR